jgi:hypothetical protein
LLRMNCADNKSLDPREVELKLQQRPAAARSWKRTACLQPPSQDNFTK